jgi:hypothetical protein
VRPASEQEGADAVSSESPAVSPFPEPPRIAVTRTPTGWAVTSPDGLDGVGDLVEGLCLADLLTEELGGSTDPDRSARRSARGPSRASEPEDPREARLAALERTVAQLEHALAARVSTERAIGVLAERHGASPREAFETLRQSARSQGRAVTELAREVLDGLAGRLPSPSASAPEATPVDASGNLAPPPRPPLGRRAGCGADGRR